MKFHISLVSLRDNAEHWGDYEFARSLSIELEKLGHHSEFFYRGEDPALTGDGDIVLRIVGPHLEEPVEGVPNILWMINQPNIATFAALNRYQAVYCASGRLTKAFQDHGIPVEFLAQATHLERFSPDHADPSEDRYRFVFVGQCTSRAPRLNVRRAIRLGYPVHVWGQGWKEKVPPELFGGEHVDIDELANIYARSDVIFYSHMVRMAELGFMSNRTFDALASGARVISDEVAGFDVSTVPGLHMPVGRDAFETTVKTLSTKLRMTHEQRRALSETIKTNFNFTNRAETFVQTAERLLADGRIHRSASPRSLTPLSIKMASQDAGAPHQLRDPSHVRPGIAVAQAMHEAAQDILILAHRLDHGGAIAAQAPIAEERTGCIHPLMADLRLAQALATRDLSADDQKTWQRLTARASRIIEATPNPHNPLSAPPASERQIVMLQRIADNRPLFHTTPPGLNRDRAKHHVALWPKRSPTSGTRPIGLFLHLYYSDLAGEFADRLADFPHPMRLYISTDTTTKAHQIASTFPDADIRVFENRGRDIWPKLYGFADAYNQHDIVLHLHGKKSVHSKKLDDWLALCLDCLLPQADEVRRIQSFFDSCPSLGMIAPLVPRKLLSAAHWGENYDFAREVMHRLGYDGNPPGVADLQFPVGSMFWARTATIKPLIDLNLRPEHFAPEAGQVDATLAHAIERMFGVVCQREGYQMIRVAPSDSTLYRGFQHRFATNGALRAALQAGDLG